MIEFDKVSKAFHDNYVLQDINFEVEKGETFVLLGTSGCGKTTTLRMINRLIEPTKGKININDQDIRSFNPIELRRGIGYVIQDLGLFPHYTVFENISTVPKLLSWEKTKIHDSVYQLLELLHLPPGEYINRYPNELSGGQQQRISIARALAANPDIVLMDEPFGALDPITRKNVRKEFVELEQLLKKTIVLVTHDVSEALELGDRICLMDKGKVIQVGSPKELIFKPTNDFVKSFFEQERIINEMRILTVEDVFKDLPSEDIGSQDGVTLQVNESIYSVFEKIFDSSSKVDYINLCDKNNSVLKTVHKDRLISSLFNYKDAL